MKTTELKKLKLNVTNIKSSLFSYGKQSKKIRSDRKSFFSKEESENKKNEKENKIESPLEKIKSIGSNIKQRLIAGPMSILDKIKEFLTIIVFGLLVNNLPKIIAGLQKFFGNNPWILKTIEWTIKTIGKGILGFIDLVNNFSKFAGGTYATIAKTTQDIKKQIDGLGNLYNNSEKEIKDLITKWTSFFNPKPTAKPSTAASATAAQAYAKSKGKYYSSTTGKTYANYATALKNPQVMNGAQQQITSIQQQKRPKQKLASGGTVSSSRSNAVGTSARPETRTSTVATSPFARPGGTAKGRKAVQSVNYFGAFNKNTKNSERNTKMSEENTNKFEDITERLKAVNKLKSKLKDDKSGNATDRGNPNDTGDGNGGGGLEGATVFEGQGADRVWNFFKGKKLSDIAVSGIMGNAQQESGFNPTIAHSQRGNGGKFIGIFQWGNGGDGDRWGQLVKWAKKKKYDPENIDTQLEWTWVELEGSYNTAYNEIKNAKTPEEAAQIWYEKYEVASDGLTKRQNYARGFYKKYKGKLPKAITKVSQRKLPPLPERNLSGQQYGAERIGKDGKKRQHAGVDFPIGENDYFYSRIGGVVTYKDFDPSPKGYGNYIDIYNSKLNVTERIAEGRQVLVKKGDSVNPGDKVVQGLSATGVIHYEIRKGKSTTYGYAGTVNPVKFLEDLGANKTAPKVAKQNLPPLTEIVHTMQDLKKDILQLGPYTLTLDGTNLKVEKKGPLGALDVLGLWDINVDVKNKDNLETLKKLLNDLKYYKNKQPPENYRNYGGNASIRTVGKDGNMIASRLNTGDPNQKTILVNNRIIQPIVVSA